MRWLALFPILFSVSACKLAVTSPDTGSVETLSGTYNCTADSPCMIDVVDYYFDETFVPRAEPGQAFIGWANGEDSLCGGLHSNCNLRTVGLEHSAELATNLQSDDTYTLAPRFADHDRETFRGEWYGELLGSTALRGTENETVVIALEGTGISIVEERWSERSVCQYDGLFSVSSEHSRNAREAISGAYACTGDTASNGQFSGTIYAITDHQIVLELDVTPEEGLPRTTVSVLHRDNFILRETLARAAELPGKPFTAEHLGDYEANQVMGGPKCAAFPAEDSHASFEISGSVGNLTIKTRILGSEDCEFEQTSSTRLLGAYTCDNGTQGLWEADDIRVHETPHGSLLSMELNRMGQFCAVLHLAGWRAGSYPYDR